jgi:hypothetical protein
LKRAFSFLLLRENHLRKKDENDEKFRETKKMLTFPSDSNRGKNCHQYLQDIKTFIFAKISIGLCSYVTMKIIFEEIFAKNGQSCLAFSVKICLPPVSLTSSCCLQESMAGYILNFAATNCRFCK